MDQEILDMMLGAETFALGAFENAVEVEQIYAPITQFITDSRGIFKAFASIDGTPWQRFDGEFDVGRLMHRNFTFKVDMHGKVLETPIMSWEKLKAFFGDEYPQLLANAMQGYAFHVEEELTKLLKRLQDGTNAGNLYHDSLFYGEDIALPNSGANPGAKVTNKGASVPRTDAGLRASYFAAKKLFRQRMPKPDGNRYHVNGSMRNGLGLFYPQSMEEQIASVFDTGETTSRDVKDKITGVKEFHEMPTWDDEGINSLIYYPINKVGRLMPLLVGQSEEGIEFSNDFPRTEQASNYLSREQQRLRVYTTSAVGEMEVAPGSIYGSVLIPLQGAPDSV